MAKRSIGKARAREAQRAAQPPRAGARPPSLARSRGFWFGALAAAAVLVPLAVIAVLAFGGNGDDPGASEPSQEQAARVESDPEELSKQFAKRDKQQIEELTTRTRSMVETFTPVIVGLGKTLPPDTERTGPLATAAELDDWRGRVREADEYFADSVSGETATNVARNGFANAVDVLVETLETYKLALEQSSARAALLERARAQRDLAARTWSTAAVQLDAINIDAGFGHQHVVFPSSAGRGSVPPDTLPEGTDAEAPEDR